jgi:hypothetical protein
MSWHTVVTALGRNALWPTAKRVTAVALVVAAVVTFSLFSPAYRYLQSEGYRQAPFELWVNGPIDDATLRSLRAIEPKAASAAIADVTPRYLESRGKRTVLNSGRFAANAADLALLYPNALLIAGSPPNRLEPGEIALDRETLEALDAHVGDVVGANFLDMGGTEFNVKLRVASEVITTAYLRSSIGGILTPEIDAAIASDIPPYSSFFVAPSDLAAFEAGVKGLHADLQVLRRSDLLDQAVAQANQLVDPFRELMFLLVSLAVLLIFLLRDLRAMLSLRSRAAAVLIGLGVRPSVVVKALLLEQLLLLGLGLIVGLALGTAWFVWGMRLPVPLQDWGLLAIAISGVVSSVTAMTVVLVMRQLAAVPVTRLLFEGS